MKLSKILALAAAFIILGSWPASAAGGVANDWTCIPFQRVGPITPATTGDDLVRLFGESNVTRKTIYVAEGTETRDVSVVYPGNKDQLIVFWQDNIYGSAPASVSVRKSGAAWKTADGVTVGTSLEELNRLNGRSFRITGFGWDYGGFVMFGEQGALVSVKGLSLRLSPARQLPRDCYGDGTILDSADPRLLPDAVRVSVLDITLNAAKAGGTPDIEDAQRTLNRTGYDCGPPDGILGPQTEQALRTFRRLHNIYEDDPLGPETRQYLQTADKEAPPLNRLLGTVPEIARLAAEHRDSDLVMYVQTYPDPAGKDSYAREYYNVYIGLRVGGHSSRWGSFLVSKDLKTILWDNPQDGKYYPLDYWRKNKN